MASKRPIDLFRESAGSVKTPPECGNAVALLGCERQHRMYILGETGISSGVFADQIDPERKNPAIPKIVQKVELHFGSTTDFVEQTVGMAMTVFNDGTHLPEGFDREQAFLEALSVAQDLGELWDARCQLSHSEEAVRERLQRGALDMGKLPKTQNLRGRSNQCMGHLANVRSATVRLAQMFYPKRDRREGWSEALKREFESIFRESDDRRRGIFDTIDYLRAVVHWRNAFEHPKANEQVIFRDYELSPEGVLIAPTIEIEHGTVPLQRQDLIRFLECSVSSLGNAFETLISVCCDQNVRQFSDALTTRLVRYPNDELVRGSRYLWQSQWNEGFPLASSEIAEHSNM